MKKAKKGFTGEFNEEVHGKRRNYWISWLNTSCDYIINDDDGSISVNGDVIFPATAILQLPFIFRKVDGNFDASNLALKSKNNLPATFGLPREVTKNFTINNNPSLLSLEGGPISVGGHYSCCNCGLSDLTGITKKITTLMFSHNYLRKLIGVPETVNQLDCSNNLLTTLEGCPEGLDRLKTKSNALVDLLHLPKEMISLVCSSNKLKTTKGCPIKLNNLDLDNNRDLKTIDGLPLNEDCVINIRNTCITKEKMDKWLEIARLSSEFSPDASDFYGDLLGSIYRNP